MKMNKLICIALLVALMLSVTAVAHAAAFERAWMEYEDYSDGRAEQSVEDPDALIRLEEILLRAKDNPADLDGATINCTLFCMTPDGEIFDFACATNGTPIIVNGSTGKVYSLTTDYDAFWDIFHEVRDGMGFDAASFFDFDE